MGTPGCINDMLQRDKENRALRKLSKGRMRDHYKYLIERKGANRRDVTIEEIEEIRKIPPKRNHQIKFIYSEQR